MKSSISTISEIKQYFNFLGIKIIKEYQHPTYGFEAGNNQDPKIAYELAQRGLTSKLIGMQRKGLTLSELRGFYEFLKN